MSHKLQAAEHEIAGEVTAAFQEYEAARMQLVEIERDLLGALHRSARCYRLRLPGGREFPDGSLDAQRAFNETMSAYYGAQADFRRAAGKLETAMGKEMEP